jgi:hypothetical protein
MLKRILLIGLLAVVLTSCKALIAGPNAKKTVQPRYHKGYYKKHTYFKHYRVGRVHIKLFEKQGVKTVKKN